MTSRCTTYQLHALSLRTSHLWLGTTGANQCTAAGDFMVYSQTISAIIRCWDSLVHSPILSCPRSGVILSSDRSRAENLPLCGCLERLNCLGSQLTVANLHVLYQAHSPIQCHSFLCSSRSAIPTR